MDEKRTKANLFAYGTLMFADVWRRIHIGEFTSEPATLRGFSIYRVQDAVFPGIVRSGEDCQVSGRVYRNLDDDTIFELDAYESDLYERVEVEVTLEGGAPLRCFAYVIPPARREALTDEHWDAAWFEKTQLTKYLEG